MGNDGGCTKVDFVACRRMRLEGPWLCDQTAVLLKETGQPRETAVWEGAGRGAEQK